MAIRSRWVGILPASAMLVIGLSSPALPQANTPAQRAACEGDVMRLCFWYVPRRARIIQCMQAKHDQLSPRCARVFDAGMAKLGRNPRQ